jgi:glycosyltransferase involved in cell wall biosynthesis
MRVLHVIARLNVGGTARYITQLSQELPKHGIEVLVVAGHVQGAEVEDPTAVDIKLLRIKSLGRSINPIKDCFAHIHLQKIIKEFKPDIIHSHTFKAGLIVRVRKQLIPVVHTFHGHLFDDPEFTGLKSRIITPIERRLAKRTTKLVSVGKRVGDELIEKNVGNKGQYINIPPGVNELIITPRAEAFKNLGINDDGRPVIGWIARVTGVKNPMRALEVARVIPSAHFVVAGGGDLLEEVRETAPSNVSVLGWAKAEDLFGVSDIILSTSENEGMPIALIEAQLAGKPVVATDVGGVSEVIANHETGLVTNKNSGSLAAAVNSLILDSQKHTQMSTLATSRARALFSVDQMVNAHVSLYKSIMN